MISAPETIEAKFIRYTDYGTAALFQIGRQEFELSTSRLHEDGVDLPCAVCGQAGRRCICG